MTSKSIVSVAIIILFILIIIPIVAVFLSYSKEAQEASTQPEVLDGGQSATPIANTCQTESFSDASIETDVTTLTVALALTPAQHKQGLSYCQAVPEGRGMYFVFDEPKKTSFWMRDMTIPLDIVWIAQNTVIGVSQSVPAPAPGTELKDLPLYDSPGEITGVLEVGAGMAEQYGLRQGSTAKLLTE